MQPAVIIFERLAHKETKGCHRYQAVDGDRGVETIYLRKEHFGDKAPDKVQVTITQAS